MIANIEDGNARNSAHYTGPSIFPGSSPPEVAFLLALTLLRPKRKNTLEKYTSPDRQTD